ncbi:AEC family transporter [Salinisphaera sp. T31B1]|uniref:AEC family transporter n=1 Tax=Salinisphaera sp. T31B1 TaxID=727963 RepID=UPI003342AA5E
MLAVQNALGPLFLLILVGAALGWMRYPGGDFWPRAERLIYYVLFPALLTHTLAIAPVAEVPIGRLAVVVIGSLLVFATVLWMLRWRLRLSGPAFTSVFQGALRFNTYVAIAGATALHGAAGTTASAVAIALMVPTVNVLCVGCFIAAGTLGRTGLWRSVLELLRNPLILACIAGIVLNLSGIGLPGWSDALLGLTGRAALPLGLLAVGVALRPAVLMRAGRAFWVASAIKLVALPALAMLAALLLGLDPVTRDVALLFTAMSTSTSAYVLARELGGDSDLMAGLITGQTLLAMLTLPLWLGLLS